MPSKEALVYLHQKKPRQTRCDQLNQHEDDIRTWMLSGLSLSETLVALNETHRIEVKKSLLHYYITQNLPELMKGRKRGRPRVTKKSKEVPIKAKKKINKASPEIKKKITKKKEVKKSVVKKKTNKVKNNILKKKIVKKKIAKKVIKNKSQNNDQSFFNF